jgi:PucR C-terminal helix-turn-helix domain/GGDEF-like domain
MQSGVGIVVRRLRARQEEIEDAIFAKVREAVPEPDGGMDTEYAEGLRAAVAAAVEFGLAGIEQDDRDSEEIPAEAVAQARLAARNGVSLEAVLRRYIVGHALLWDYVMGEADHLERTGRSSGLREMSRAQAGLLDRLVIGVTREHVAELQRAGRSREHRVLERVRMILAGEDVDDAHGALDRVLDYELGGEHLGVIVTGACSEALVRDLARELDRRLLCVPRGERMVWAWFGGLRVLEMVSFERALVALGARCENCGPGRGSGDASVVVGEPATGLAGWRLTHRQAQDALLVAQRRPQRLTRYCDVALLAVALRDELLSQSLIDMYLLPLEDSDSGDPVLLGTLQAYVAAGRNASNTASMLKVARSTVENRLRMTEERLGRTLRACLAEFEVALRLAELKRPTDGL